MAVTAQANSSAKSTTSGRVVNFAWFKRTSVKATGLAFAA